MRGTGATPRSARVVFHYPRPDDAEAVCALRQDSLVMRHLGGPLDTKAARRTFEGDLEHWERHGYGRYVVLDAATGDFVGFCGLQLFEGVPDLGYLLAPQWWGQGLATEIAEASLRHGHDELDIPLIRAFTQTLNFASQRVLSKVGMRYLGERVLWGARHRCYAMTETDWACRYPLAASGVIEPEPRG
jgi:[ribosomal protein S5]-alanine N-acetyltransferase